MKVLKQPFILFFIAGVKPTPEELKAVSLIQGRIGMRNASRVNPEDKAEPCDGVAGSVPEGFYRKLPTADEAIARFRKSVEDAANLVGDKPAPKPKTPPKPEADKKDGDKTPAGFDNLPGGDGKPPAWGSPPAKK